MGGDGHASRAGPERGHAGHERRARHPWRPADDQHMPEVALVCIALPRLEKLLGKIVRNAFENGLLYGIALAGHADACEDQSSRMIDTFAKEIAGLQADKAHGDVGTYRTAKGAAGVTGYSARNIQREYRNVMIVAQVDYRAVVATDLTHEPAAKQAVDNQVNRTGQDAGEGLHPAAAIDVVRPGNASVAAEQRRIGQRQDHHVDAVVRGKPRNNVSVSGIVTGPGKNQPVLGGGIRPAGLVVRRPRRTIHQFVAGDTVSIDGTAINLANDLDRVYFNRQVSHNDDYTDRRSGRVPLSMQVDFATLKTDIKRWAQDLGFQALGVAGIDLAEAEGRLAEWLTRRFHGSMDYMERHGTKRSRPDELVPGTIRVISVRMDYLAASAEDAISLLDDPQRAYVTRYALGRDYHKVLRKRLQKLATRIESHVGPFGYRAFVDSAPVLEKPLAEQAGIGWIGKHTNLLSRDAGSWFFLGELFTDLPLPADDTASAHCGTCTACIDVCPTRAIVAPYVLDARRCISYLTIESKHPIPVEFRDAIGNRIYGCDDCQLFCPWNKFAQRTSEDDFKPRHSLDDTDLVDLFAWTEDEWLARTEGSAIRRIGYERWLGNIAIALGNAEPTPAIHKALLARRDFPSNLVRDHVSWAIDKQDRLNAETR